MIRNPASCDCWSPKKSFSEKTLEDHIELINHYKLKKAIIIAENIDFVKQCPTLQYLEIIPASTSLPDFDYTPLYSLPMIKYLNCTTSYGEYSRRISTQVDYSKINGLLELRVDGYGHQNYNQINSLEKLFVLNDNSFYDLQSISCSSNLKKLWLAQNKIESLKGIKQFSNLQELSLEYLRKVDDISELIYISSSLRILCIQNCPQITDFSSLYKLSNLEHLELYGNNDLSDLTFLENMPNLKTFSFSMNVKNYDLSPCLKIPYAHSLKNRKEYNYKDKDLPKGQGDASLS